MMLLLVSVGDFGGELIDWALPVVAAIVFFKSQTPLIRVGKGVTFNEYSVCIRHVHVVVESESIDDGHLLGLGNYEMDAHDGESSRGSVATTHADARSRASSAYARTVDFSCCALSQAPLPWN